MHESFVNACTVTIVWAFSHSPTCNDEEGENAGKKCILAPSGECEAENKVAKKSSAYKTMKCSRLCFVYIYNLNRIMDCVHFITLVQLLRCYF